MLSQTSDAGLFIANDKGYFREQGFEIQSLLFQNAQQMVSPLGAGQLDVGGGATSASLLNAVARDVPIRIVADKGSTPPGFGFQGLVVRKELIDRGAFSGCSSFKGYRIAVSGRRPEPRACDRRACPPRLWIGNARYPESCRLSSFPDMPAAARNGAIDAAILIEPLLTNSLANGTIGLYKRTDEFYPNQQIAVLLYAPHMITQQRPVGGVSC